jgi:hypothetical protein
MKIHQFIRISVGADRCVGMPSGRPRTERPAPPRPNPFMNFNKLKGTRLVGAMLVIARGAGTRMRVQVRPYP